VDGRTERMIKIDREPDPCRTISARCEPSAEGAADGTPDPPLPSPPPLWALRGAARQFREVRPEIKRRVKSYIAIGWRRSPGAYGEVPRRARRARRSEGLAAQTTGQRV
jgi:hypothetical protein